MTYDGVDLESFNIDKQQQDEEDSLPDRHNYSVKDEIWPLWKLSMPVIAYYLLQALPGLVNVIFMGRLGREELASAALGFMFCNVTGISIVWGLTTALDTLATQAFGAKAFKRVGLVCQRGWVIVMLAMFPVAAIWLNSNYIFAISGQTAVVASLSVKYTRIVAIALPAVVTFAVLQKYLQSMHILVPVLVVGLIANGINIALNYLLIVVLKVGFIGAPICVVVTFYLMAIMLLVYCMWKVKRGDRVLRSTWPNSFSMESLREWSPFMKLAIPGMFMICLEWWAYELCALIAGSQGELELASYAIILQLWGFSFMVPLGFGVAVSIRVGYHLGADSPDQAKNAMIGSYIITFIWTLIAAIIILVFRAEWYSIFTNDVVVGHVVSYNMYFVAASQVLDALQALASGVLRGLGKQLLGAYVNFVGFYIVGLPLAVVFVIVMKYGVFGCVLGLLIGLGVQNTLLGVVLGRQSWIDASRLAIKLATAEVDLVDHDHTSNSNLKIRRVYMLIGVSILLCAGFVVFLTLSS